MGNDPRQHTRAGLDVSPESALTLAAYFAGVNVISTDVAMLPLKVFRRRRSGGRDEVRDHPVADLLGVSPDGETTSMRWRQASLGHVLGWGNGYAEIAFDGRGGVRGLHLLHPGCTHADRNLRTRELYYRTGPQTLPPYRVLHFAGLGFDGLTGYSPVQMAKQAIGLGLATEGFGAALFGNGSRPGGVLKHPGELSDPARERMAKDWENIHKGVDNAHKIAILEEGVEFQGISINPEDAQFLATRQFQVLEIARMFRLPPHKLGDYSQSHLSNIEAANIDYLVTTIGPWCEAIEQEINLKLFTGSERSQGLYVEHQMQAFLRGDMKSRGEWYTRIRDLGLGTPNMFAEWENLNPIGPDGDLRLVPLNMVPLDQAGRPADPAPVSTGGNLDDGTDSGGLDGQGG